MVKHKIEKKDHLKIKLDDMFDILMETKNKKMSMDDF